MLKAIKKRNFSGYVKKLIMADLNIRKGLIFDEMKSEEKGEIAVEKIDDKLSIEQLKKRSQLNQQNKKSVDQPQAPKVFRPNN
jgi:exopolyphosphatase/pppGpp-phosphohydrolase